MKFQFPIAACSLIASLSAAEVPAVFAGLLQPDVPVKGQIVVVMPPPEIDKYVAKVEAAARKDPQWFREFSGNAKNGVPLPYDERLGLTKAEYDEYISLWNKREFKPIEEVMLLLRSSGESWSIASTGSASIISTLRFSEKADLIRSPNGELKRLEDIKADSNSILGEWTGPEWRFEEETSLGKMKENIAIGRLTGKNTGLIVYRAQELSPEGKRLLDKSLVIRFPLGAKAPEAKPAAKETKAPAKPAPKKKP